MEIKRLKVDTLPSTGGFHVKTLDSFSEKVERDMSQEGTSTPLSISHSVRHEVAIPIDYPYVPIAKHVPLATPARTYPFQLDPFQRVSISCLERNESVLVSAHTSAGKTVVAEYAIAMSLRDKQRVIYTSPIKALSNQKYRELYEEFSDVGLMTGDVTINPTASCLVMTTEILRSMLYRGSEVMREVAWVVFDEIHYMRDKERGVVWEETIILLPNSVHYVFLSATIPNAKQFAEWICEIHSQPCHVVYTDYRPTPLQHYLFPQGGDGIHLVVDEKGTFREENFQRALNVLPSHEDDLVLGANGKGSQSGRMSKKKNMKGPNKGGPSDLYKIVKMIMTKNYHPVIVFSFSKRECEAYALQMSKIDFNTEDEKRLVHTVFTNAIDSLSDDDKGLPQIENILPLLKRGIGIHHSGLLPILKEVIEILFQEGLIKVLFATETFSIGLNMPAKTVLFTSVRKFDGKDFRWISSGEYIQMSGRAGRRGLDDRGIVILMLDEKMEPDICKNMIKGNADHLNSAFHLTYNMVLNLIRVDGMSPEFMLERSFHQFQNNSSLPSLDAQVKDLTEDMEKIVVDDEAVIGEYYHLKAQIDQLAKAMKSIMMQPEYIVPFIQPGRLIKVKADGKEYDWGVVLNIIKKSPQKTSLNYHQAKEATSQAAKEVQYVVDALLYCSKNTPSEDKSFSPVVEGEKGEMMVVPIILSTIDSISTLRIFIPNDLRDVDNRQSVHAAIKEVKNRFSIIPLLDPIEDLKIEEDAFKKIVMKIEILEQKLKQNPMMHSSKLEANYESYERKIELGEKIKLLKRQIKQATSVMQMDELKYRKRVLRRLGYTSLSDVIEMKGRVACEISTGDELLLTEMIFNGVFNNLTVEQSVALLSCFVFQEKSEETAKLKEELAGPLRMMQESARRIARVSQESKLPMNEEDYVGSFRPELMDVVHAWCQGAKFIQICKMTDVFEGSIIRCMRRLEELLRQMCQAAKSIGNTELENKFAEGINKIKRDIIFANSLYL